MNKLKQGKRNGFTLVEVIIVLVILAVLAAILIPTYVHYIKKANEKACQVVRMDLLRYKDLYLTAYDQVNFNNFEAYIYENYGKLDSLCPGGGKYTLKTDLQEINIICSKHGNTRLAGYAALRALQNLMKTDKTLINYFATRGDGTSLDSEADTNGKFAQYTNDLLNKLGTDPASSSWRLYKEVKNGKTQYYVYWTDTEISKLKPGEKVNASRCTLSPEGAVGPIEDVSCSVEEKKASGSTNTKKFNVIGHLK